MEKYDEIINLLNEKISKINENKLISYSEKSYVMFLIIKKMEKNYKSSDDLLIFHQALRNWMREHVAMIWIEGSQSNTSMIYFMCQNERGYQQWQKK